MPRYRLWFSSDKSTKKNDCGLNEHERRKSDDLVLSTRAQERDEREGREERLKAKRMFVFCSRCRLLFDIERGRKMLAIATQMIIISLLSPSLPIIGCVCGQIYILLFFSSSPSIDAQKKTLQGERRIYVTSMIWYWVWNIRFSLHLSSLFSLSLFFCTNEKKHQRRRWWQFHIDQALTDA